MNKKKKIIITVASVITLIAIVAIIAIIVHFAGGKSSNAMNGISATVDEQAVAMYSKASKAKTSVDVTGNGTLLVEIPADCEAEVTVRGTVGGIQKEYSATTNISSDNIMNALLNTGIAHQDGNAFTLNANQFDDGAIVTVTIESHDSNSSILDQRFGADNSKSAAFAFTAHKSKENTADGENTASDSSSTSTGEQDIFAESVQPSGEIQLNESISFDTYSSKDDALNHVQELPSNFETNCTVQVFPGENTLNCSIIADSVYDSNGEKEKNPQFEVIIGNTTDFVGNVDITSFRGKTVLFCIMYVSKGEKLVPHNSYEYFAVKVPAE
jgi:hypothetical protein